MDSSRSLRTSLQRLRGLRFHRYDQCADTVRAWFRLRGKIDRHPLAEELWRVHDWLIAPLTLQALDYTGLARMIVSLLQQGASFDADLILLLRLIDVPPSPAKIEQMTRHETAVAEGLYDSLAKEPKRFEEIETKITSDPMLKQFWNRLKNRYGKLFLRNARGVMRRTLARERGFECRHTFSWRKKRDRFQITFDALCYRWCLYGYEKDDPLALKLTANPTPHGTMIFIPREMSLAAHGTLAWKAITLIHRAHGAGRQGGKLSAIRIERRSESQMAKRYDAEARRLGLKGDRRWEYTLAKLGQLPNRKRWVRRLVTGC